MDITPAMREEYLRETGNYSSDTMIVHYFLKKDLALEEEETGFTKHDTGKPQLSFPVGMQTSMAAIANVMAFGAQKYSRDNWRKAGTEEQHRYLDAALRHLSSHCAGDLIDDDSTLPHIHHALTSLAMYVDLYNPPKKDSNA